MHRLFAFVLLTLSLYLPSAAAQSIASMEDRQAWASSQVLVRGAMKVEVAATSTQVAQTFWLFFERTPNARVRIITKDQLDGPTRLTFLVQDKASLALSGEDVGNPAAPWMLGHYLFTQPMEPSMLLSWAMGVPGRDFQVDAPAAIVKQASGKPSRIEQAGWQVDYASWTDAAAGQLSVPATFSITSATSEIAMKVSLAKIETYLTPPEGYSEFKIL